MKIIIANNTKRTALGTLSGNKNTVGLIWFNTVNLAFVFRVRNIQDICFNHKKGLVGWLVVLGLTVFSDSISVYIRPSPIEREKEKRNDRREKKCPNNPHLLQVQ